MRMKVSIITVTYNCVNTLKRTIDSVLEQNNPELEYVLVDGSSTDGTLDLIKNYKERYPDTIRYISEKDNGLYDAMNKGIRLTSGDLIGIINGDDYYTANAIDEAVKLAASTGADIIYSDLLYCRGNEIDYAHPLKSNHERLVERMNVNHPTCFVKKDTYEKYGVFDTDFKIAADYELMARFYKSGCHFEKAPVVLAVMEYGGVSSNNKKSINEKYMIHKKYFTWTSAEFYRIRNIFSYYIRKIRK